MRISILFILCIFVFNKVYTQNGGVNCVLLDDLSKPISDANIRVINQSYGCISTEDGVFSIPMSILPVELEISHIGFQTKRIVLKDSLVNKSDGLLKIYLHKKVHVFKEVEILNQKTKLLSKRENRWSMIDYCINDDYAMVLYKKGWKRKIKYISITNNVSFEKALTIKADKIVADLLGHTFLMLDEVAIQFNLQKNDSVFLFPTLSINYFEDNIEPILGIIDDHLVFSSSNRHNQEISYWSGNSDQRNLIYRIYNKNRYAFAQGIIDEQQESFRNYGHINPMGELSNTDLNISRRQQLLYWTYSMIATIPEYSPAYIEQDTIFIFDHVNSLILSFDVYGNMLDSVTIDYHKNKRWGKEILFDQEQKLFYTKLSRNGRISLYLINIKTGEISFTCEIDGTIFPEKMTVHDGKIYFMSFDIYHQRILVQQKIL